MQRGIQHASMGDTGLLEHKTLQDILIILSNVTSHICTLCNPLHIVSFV